MTTPSPIDTWLQGARDDAEAFLAQLVKLPTDTPPGDNAPHADRAATLLTAMGFAVERHVVPEDLVRAQGLRSITNLVVHQRFGDGPTIALHPHGEELPPGAR